MQKVICLVALILVTLLSHAQQTELKLTLEKGKTYKQVTQSVATIVQEVGGQKMTITAGISGVMTFLVTGVSSSGYDMEVRYESLTMSMELPQGKMEFSSENESGSDIFSAILREVINKPFTLTMTTSGKITRVGDVDKLWDGAINQFSQLPQAQRDQIKAQLMNSYGENALKGNIEMVTAVYPERPVRPGEKWTVNTDLKTGMSAKLDSEYEFQKVTADHIFMKGRSKIQTDKEASVQSNGMAMTYNLSGIMITEIKANRKTGWIEEAKISQEISGDAQIQDNPQVPGGMSIPMTMTTQMTISN